MNITALLPIKNGEPWIAQILSCISKNIIPGDELLIIDDGSTDNSRDLAMNVGSNLPMRILKNPGIGLVAALNYGVSQSNTNWIARFDVDDLYSPSRLEVQRALIHSGVAAIFSDYSFQSESGEYLGYIPSPVSHHATTISLINSQRTAHPSSLFSKEAFIGVGGYREKDFPAEDLSLWIRLSRAGELISAPKSLLQYTLRRGSVTGESYFSAKSKHQQLFSEFNFGKREANLAVENLESTFSLYKVLPEKSLLRLLHLYDLSRAIKLGFLERKQLNWILLKAAKELSHLGATRETISLLYYRSRRRQFRNIR